MSFQTLQELKDNLTTIALSKGMTSSKPVMLVLNNSDTGFKAVRISVSHAEPAGDSSPLGLLWYVKAYSSDNEKLLVRTSRSASGSYKNTWSEVVTLTSVYIEQTWDIPIPENQEVNDLILSIGNPHRTQISDLPGAVSATDGVLDDPLNARTLEAEEDYGAQELVPNSWVNNLLNPMRATNVSIQQFFANINGQMANIRNRVVALEQKILGVKGFIYRTESAATSWTVAHGMSSSDVTVQVYEGSEVVWPANITVVDDNTVQIDFAEPVSGSAQILPVSST